MQQPDAHVVVVVVRTGGIAGLRRQWRVAPAVADAPRWVALIDDCPWDADLQESARGADRYVWSITATTDAAAELQARIPDSRLDGPWRTLVDEVRDAATSER